MRTIHHTIGSLAALATLLAASTPAQAARRDYPAQVTATTTLDQATQFHTYAYSATNPSSNPAGLDTIVVKLQPGVDVITDIRSPRGWRALYSEDIGQILWAAVGYDEPDADDPSGDIPQSDYAVLPGQSLAGFSFKSFSPPGTGTIITQTYAPLPVAASESEVEDLVNDPAASQLPDDNGYRIQSTTPIPDADWSGNRRPTVDGFLVFANLDDKSVFKAQALIVLRLAAGGEQVDPASLQVDLNGTDVTGSFSYNAQYKGYAATFVRSSSPLRVGNNVLRTSIAGTIPGVIDRPTRDTDRVAFELLP